MPESHGAVTFKGDPLTLVGDDLNVGDAAPDVALTLTDMSELKISDLKGKPAILSVVPSLDTPVCQVQTRMFNEKVGQLGDAVTLVTISLDLPFAQKRYCAGEGIENLKLASDYKTHDFGHKFGLRIKELGLLARCVLILDAEGNVKYKQLVKEVAEEPDYDAALAAL